MHDDISCAFHDIDEIQSHVRLLKGEVVNVCNMWPVVNASCMRVTSVKICGDPSTRVSMMPYKSCVQIEMPLLCDLGCPCCVIRNALE